MRTLWKVVLPLGLVLPMVAYVAGSLAASRSDDPVPRETIVIRDAPARTPTDLQTSAPGGDDRTGGRDDRDRRDDRDDREQDEVDDNGVRVVSPRPTPLGETDDATDDDQDDDRTTTGTTTGTTGPGGTTAWRGTGTTVEAPAATTESSRASDTPSRGALSVRTRITVAIALLTALAMGGAGLLVYTLESARIERAVTEQVDQEIAEFRQLQDGDDPKTTRPFDNVQRLLKLFLIRNVPDDDELLVGYAGGEQALRTRNRYGEQILGDPEYRDAVDSQLRTGGTTVLDSAEFGEVWVTVVPVRNNDTRGALVIVNFLNDEHSELNRTMQTYAIVAVLSLGLIVMLGGYQSGRLLAPLRTLRQTAEEISATDLSRRIPTRGNDDITALTRTVNGMLDRLESAFRGQREFLDDAGHELKTPLTVLRGHLEVLDSADAEDVEETRRLLLDEVDRMSRLVGDLILLAKSRRPDFLTARPVEVAPLTELVLAKARALGDREWQLDEVADVTAVLDEQRITQAVLQLADNAVKHTEPGDVVAIGSARDGDRVRLWVRDTGPGVPDAAREHVFERFGRSAVRPGDEGFGLGLSIVRAIVEAHRGRVWVEPADIDPEAPSGARFVVELSLEEDPWLTS